MARLLSSTEYVEGILVGDISILARAITIVESDSPKYRKLAEEILNGVYHNTGKAKRIGITGVPGAGKSTFIESFASYLCNDLNYTVAVLAIDPSSSISGGSILGDKVRMEQLSRNPKAFIRPSPSSGTLGGVSRKTREVILLCEAAGFDFILVETVGVGQGEFLARSMVDFFLMLTIPGAGDELQGIKRGIMELVDGIVVNKSDGDRVTLAEKSKNELLSAIHYIRPLNPDWKVFVETVSSLEHRGIETVVSYLLKFFELNNAYITRLRRYQTKEWLEEFFKQTVLDTAYAKYGEYLKIAQYNIEQGLTNELVESRKLVDRISEWQQQKG